MGVLAALGAALLFGCGIVLQARETRKVSHEHAMRPRLLVRLARSGPWLVGTALTLVGWGLQALALGVAPITLVQPLLGLTLVVVIVLGWGLMGDRVQGADVAAIVLVAGGTILLVLAAPSGTARHPGGPRLIVPLVVLGALALVPLVIRRGSAAILAACGAGVAFALCGIATKLLGNSISQGHLAAAVLALAAVAASAAIGGISEMSALQSGVVSRVVATVFALEIALPVVLAPIVFAERWDAMGAIRVATVLGAVAAVLAGTTMLARAEGVAAATPSPSPRVPTSS